jgi:hypothetical protein
MLNPVQQVVGISFLVGALFMYAIMVAWLYFASAITDVIKEKRELKLLASKKDKFIQEYITYRNQLVNWSDTKKENKW